MVWPIPITIRSGVYKGLKFKVETDDSDILSAGQVSICATELDVEEGMVLNFRYYPKTDVVIRNREIRLLQDAILKEMKERVALHLDSWVNP